MTPSHPALAIVPGLAALAIACTSAPAPATGPELLAASRRALGARADSIWTIWAVASVTSPSGGFETRIASARNGRTRMALGRGLNAGVRGTDGWMCDSLGQPGPLDSVVRSVIRGHDLHMLVVAPNWMAAPVRDPDGRWGNDSVMTLRFQDELGAPLLLHLRRTDTLPVGLDVVNHTGAGARDVRVSFEDWRPVDGARLFHRATFEHGGNSFIYAYRELTLDRVSEAMFDPGCGAVSVSAP